MGATAQSIREQKSKLRYSFQNYAWVKLDLVRGKAGWKIINGSEGEVFRFMKRSGAEQKMFARICLFVMRLVQGEVRDSAVLEILLSLANFLETNKISQQLEITLETLVTLRILIKLGYADPSRYKDFDTANEISLSLLASFESVREDAVKDIKASLSASHL